MIRLSTEELAKGINCLIDGRSMRPTMHLADVAKKTCHESWVKTGEPCVAYHDKNMRDLSCKISFASINQALRVTSAMEAMITNYV